MPADDVVLNLKQIAGYPPNGIASADSVVFQRGGLGGPYLSTTAADFVGNALAQAGPMSVGYQAPPDTDGPQLFTDGLGMVLDGQLMWNCYVGGGQEKMVAGGPGWRIYFDSASNFNLDSAQATGARTACVFSNALNVSPSGYMSVGEQVRLARDPAAPMEAATSQWVQAQITAANALLQSLYATATVWSFNRRIGNIILNLNDVMGAGGAPINAPQFTGQPTAPSPSPADNSTAIATTAWVWQAVNSQIGSGVVASFNGRTGAVTLTAADVSTAGATVFAPLTSPALGGVPTAPTAATATSTGQIATTAFVHNAVVAATTGVSSFNTRTGAIVLAAADITGAGGALLASPAFTGTPQAPTAAPGTSTLQVASTAFVGAAISAAPYAPLSSPAFIGTPTGPTAAANTSTTQLATTAFVVNQIAAVGAGVTSFNGRAGAVSLIANDVSAVGGLMNPNVALTGTPTAPTAASTDNSTAIATTAFVAAALAVIGGVTSFNGRAGAVTLSASDVTGAGGALLASPAFTGTPAAPTAAATVNTTQLATTAFSRAMLAARAATTPTLTDPAGATGSPPGVMAGYAILITPQITGRIFAALGGVLANSSSGAGVGCQFALRYGTGAAPAAGAAATGTVLGNNVYASSLTASLNIPALILRVVTGLTIGTQYWFDVSYSPSGSGGGTAAIYNSQGVAVEI